MEKGKIELPKLSHDDRMVLLRTKMLLACYRHLVRREELPLIDEFDEFVERHT